MSGHPFVVRLKADDVATERRVYAANYEQAIFAVGVEAGRKYGGCASIELVDVRRATTKTVHAQPRQDDPNG